MWWASARTLPSPIPVSVPNMSCRSACCLILLRRCCRPSAPGAKRRCTARRCWGLFAGRLFLTRTASWSASSRRWTPRTPPGRSCSLHASSGRKAPLRAFPAPERTHPVPRQFPAPAPPLVHAVLLPQLDQRLLAHHGDGPLRGQGALLCTGREAV